MNDASYKPGGPVIFIFGGAQPGDDLLSGFGILDKYAPKLGAYLTGIEHRFYGESWPVAYANLISFVLTIQYLQSLILH